MSTDSPAVSPPSASVWFPLTFAGVAALAQSGAGRVFGVAIVGSLLVGVAVARTCWALLFPAIELAVLTLPEQASIVNAQLRWPSNAPPVLADNGILALRVELGSDARPGQTADLDIALRPRSVCATSLFGSMEWAYPADYDIALGRLELEPIWGAWRPHLLAAVGLGTACGCLVVWTLLSLVLAPLARAYCGLLDRQATLGLTQRLSLAALLPGAILMAVAILLYGFRQISLSDLLIANVLHLFVDTTYLLSAPLHLPALTETVPANTPFCSPSAPEAPRQNPFASASLDSPPPESSRPNPTTPDSGPLPQPPASRDGPDDPLNPS